MDVIEGIIHLIGYGAGVAMIAVATPRIGNALAALFARLRPKKMSAAE